MGEYRRCFCCKSTIHATCEDFSAAAGIDLEMDEADDRAGQKIVRWFTPYWGQKGPVGRFGMSSRPGEIKRPRQLLGAVSIAAISCRTEERSEEIYEEVRQFFRTV